MPLYILGTVNYSLHPLPTYTLPSHGYKFTVQVSAVIDDDRDPGTTEETCL